MPCGACMCGGACLLWHAITCPSLICASQPSHMQAWTSTWLLWLLSAPPPGKSCPKDTSLCLTSLHPCLPSSFGPSHAPASGAWLASKFTHALRLHRFYFEEDDGQETERLETAADAADKWVRWAPLQSLPAGLPMGASLQHGCPMAKRFFALCDLNAGSLRS